ncbi:MAG: hypothetical protein ACK5P7_00450 [Bdellovibrio sp.]
MEPDSLKPSSREGQQSFLRNHRKIKGMMTWFNRALALAFGVIFCVLMSAFIAHAKAGDFEGDGKIVVDPVDQNYPIEVLEKNPAFKAAKKKPAPWYHQAYFEKDRILKVAGLHEQIKKWSELEKDMFLDRLDRKGANEVAKLYPKISLKALKAAESEIHVVKAKVLSAPESR